MPQWKLKDGNLSSGVATLSPTRSAGRSAVARVRPHEYESSKRTPYTSMVGTTDTGGDLVKQRTNSFSLAEIGAKGESASFQGASERTPTGAQLRDVGIPSPSLDPNSEGHRHPRRTSSIPAPRTVSGLLARMRKKYRGLWKAIDNTFRRWGKSTRHRVADFVRRHVMPRVRRMGLSGKGFPPEVPPLTGVEPGQAVVAQVATQMQAGIRPNYFKFEQLTLREQLVGRYLISAMQNTWFISVPEGRSILLVKRGLIGMGGFGLVYHVEHPVTKQAFALKVFVRDKRKGALLEDMDSEIEEEFDIVKHIAPTWTPLRIYTDLHFMVPLLKLKVDGKPDFQDVRDHFRISNTCLLFPKAQGDMLELADLLRHSDEKVSFTVRMSSTIQMVKLLARFHSRGLVHGDVKLNNFLVEASGLLLLSDFTTIFKGGNEYVPPLATDSYMPPEIAHSWVTRLKRVVKYTSRTDAWMLGVAIYYLWCGTHPFGIMPQSKLIQVVGLLLRVPASALDFSNCHGIPRQFRSMVRRFLDKSPVLRLDPQGALQKYSLLHWTGQDTPERDTMAGPNSLEEEMGRARSSDVPETSEEAHGDEVNA
ncbi:rhoptry protein ROP17 [Besnoitia besnoiti]|uniref:Rhoptry protein ROP17 n=1 Tax=Besnoitia besnoiti TaxID=94643 RepID=A0A2A9M430_BESBE|nr:rhoptry protein ROP17 [Besnoitia besnoiti]PFH33248.1 rhoptry protein ROP17 [Besnoitia besnoiti]